MHQKRTLISKWEKEISKRIKNNQTGFEDVPVVVMDWIHAFNECYGNTKNLFVSTRYATVMKHSRIMNINFNEKFDIYVNSILTEEGSSCCVCYETENIMKTNCQHEMCLSCAKEWMYRSVSCPVCRTIL